MGESAQSRESADSETDADQSTITSTPQQVLAGMQVGLPDLVVVCTYCGEEVAEGQACTVYAYRPADDHEWYPARCYCQACAPDEIPTPTMGTSEVLVQAWLGVVSRPHDRSHRLCLLKVDLLASSPPSEGSPP